MKRRELLLAATACAVATAHPGAFAQQDWPACPITLVVSAEAGSAALH